jgi:glycosyltransferase involved in cell wall biosynthesis
LKKIIVIASTVYETLSYFHIDQARYFANNGFHVELISSLNSSQKKAVGSMIFDENINFNELEMAREISIWKDLISLFSWFKTLKRIKPNLVMIGTPKAALLGIFASRFLNIRNRVYIVHGIRLEGLSGIKKLFVMIAEKITCSLSSEILCVSLSVKNKLVDLKLAPTTKLKIIGEGSINGINCNLFAPPTALEKKDARTFFSLEQEDIIIGFAGRLVIDKGIKELLKVFKDLNGTYKNLSLVIAGDIERRNKQSSKIISIIESAHKVTYLGKIENMSSFYHALDIFCLPSYREGMPTVNLEASACGLPVVTSDATGCIDSVISSKTGLVAKIKDTKSLESALIKLISDQTLRIKYGLAARKFMLKNFIQPVIWESNFRYILGLLTPKKRILIAVTSSITVNTILRPIVSLLYVNNFIISIIGGKGQIDDLITRKLDNYYALNMNRAISPFSDMIHILTSFFIINKFKPDIILSSTPKASVITLCAGWISRVPIRIYQVRGIRWDVLNGLSESLVKIGDKLSSFFSTDIISVSNSVKTKWIDSNITKKNVRVLGAGGSKGVDTTIFYPDTSRIYSPESPIIGYCGRLTPDKGISDLIQTFDKLLKYTPNAKLEIIGDLDDAIPLSSSLVSQINNSKNITWIKKLGEVDLANQFRTWNLLLFPSKREGLPNVVIEAGACGVPTVGYSVTGMVDSVQSNKTGKLVPINDMEGLFDSCVEVLKYDTNQMMSQNVAKFMKDKFDSKLVEDNLMNFMNELTNA